MLYLNNEVLEDVFVGGGIVLDLIHNFVLSFFVKLLDELVDSLHFLDSGGVLFS